MAGQTKTRSEYVCYVLITAKFCVLFLDQSEHDKEGRVITAEYEKFFLVTACKFIKLTRSQI